MTVIYGSRHRQKFAARRGPKLARLFEAQKGLCFYCKCEMQMFVSDETEATRDHRTPISRGGAMTGRNVVAACNRCNFAKGDMTEAEFFDILSDILAQSDL
jgi:5-methylcytosine-specific restriction endonuclease McrA